MGFFVTTNELFAGIMNHVLSVQVVSFADMASLICPVHPVNVIVALSHIVGYFAQFGVVVTVKLSLSNSLVFCADSMVGINKSIPINNNLFMIISLFKNNSSCLIIEHDLVFICKVAGNR